MPGRVVARGPGLPRLLDGRLVQARVRRSARWPRRRRSASPPEALFDELVRQTEPGSMGLMLQPTWTPGVRVPGREAKGAMIGFGDVHTRAHLYRAILEGLAYALREGGERAAGAGEAAAPRAARVGRRRPVAGDRPADRGRLRAADRPAAHPRDVGPGRRDRRRGRDRAPPDIATAAVGEMTRRRRDARPRPGAPPRSTSSCTSASTGRCTTG